MAREIYGVSVDPGTGEVNREETAKLRREIREKRLGVERPFSETTPGAGRSRPWVTVLRIHESLEIARAGTEQIIRCSRCGHPFCSPRENYKIHSLKRIIDLNEVALRSLPSGEPYLGRYHEYICPGCGTLLQVDVVCPQLGGENDLWDLCFDPG